MKLGTRSLAIGAFVALLLFGVSYAASAFRLTGLSHLAYWQGWWLQELIPCSNIGTTEKPLCEGTPLNLVVFFLGLPLGVALYSLVMLAVLVVRRHRDA